MNERFDVLVAGGGAAGLTAAAYCARYDKTLSYYIITNCAGDKPPQTVNTVDGNHCWRTGARNTEGVPLFPDGEYAISIEATDFAGNRAEQTFRVNVRNP